MNFKVGDKVAVKDYKGSKSGIVEGLVGIVENTNHPYFPIKVKFANNTEIFRVTELRHETKLDKALK